MEMYRSFTSRHHSRISHLTGLIAVLWIATSLILTCHASSRGKCEVSDIQREGLLCSREAIVSLRGDSSLDCSTTHKKLVPNCLTKSLEKCYDGLSNETIAAFTKRLVDLTMTSFTSKKFCAGNIIGTTPGNCSQEFGPIFGACVVDFQSQMIGAPADKGLCRSYQLLSDCVNGTASKYCTSLHFDEYMTKMGEFFTESNNPYCSLQQLRDGVNHVPSSANQFVSLGMTYSLLACFALFIVLF